MTKVKHKKVKIQDIIRRNEELEMYGKLLSLRPSIFHKSKKKYTRKQKHKNSDET